MAHRAVYAALRPVARLVSAPAPSQALARAAIASHPTASPSLIFVRTKKTKPSKKAENDPDAGRGGGGGGHKKGGKGKGKMLTEDDLLERQLPGEHFELKVLEGRMQEAIDRLRVSLNTVVGRVGRITPGEAPSSQRLFVLDLQANASSGRDPACAAQPSSTESNLIHQKESALCSNSPTSRSRTAETSSSPATKNRSVSPLHPWRKSV